MRSHDRLLSHRLLRNRRRRPRRPHRLLHGRRRVPGYLQAARQRSFHAHAPVRLPGPASRATAGASAPRAGWRCSAPAPAAPSCSKPRTRTRSTSCRLSCSSSTPSSPNSCTKHRHTLCPSVQDVGALPSCRPCTRSSGAASPATAFLLDLTTVVREANCTPYLLGPPCSCTTVKHGTAAGILVPTHDPAELHRGTLQGAQSLMSPSSNRLLLPGRLRASCLAPP